MLFYYSVWLLICLFTIFFKKSNENRFIFLIVIVFLFLMTGMRYEIGGDWKNYLAIYEYFNYLGFWDSLLVIDPGYGFFNYISKNLGFKEIILVNILCSLCFYLCFYFFSKRFKNYWISLLVAFPYLILVVSMGYTRQSVAIGFFLMAVIFGLERELIKYFIFSILAFLFHKSAIIVLMFAPFFIFPNLFRNGLFFSFYTLSSFFMMSLMVYFSSIAGDNIYTEKSGEVSSAGAIFRIIVHFLPITFFLFYRSKIKKIFINNYHFFDYLALLILFTLMLAIPFSTLADRFNLYLVVFDILIFSYLYSNINYFSRQFMVGTIIIFNTLMLVVWLNFGVWSHAWLPYQNYLFNYLLESI